MWAEDALESPLPVSQQSHLDLYITSFPLTHHNSQDQLLSLLPYRQMVSPTLHKDSRELHQSKQRDHQ